MTTLFRQIAFLALFAVTSCVLSHSARSSIQGRTFEDRTNGVYDLSITDAQIEASINSMKMAIKAEDYKAFSLLLSYPCRWNSMEKSIVLKSTTDFLANKDKIISSKILKAIDMSSLEKVFVSSQGFMIGDGEIWFIPGVGITAFNT